MQIAKYESIQHVVLVEFYWTRDKDPRVPLGHASIRTSLNAWTSAKVSPLAIAVNGDACDADAISDRLLHQLNTPHNGEEPMLAVGVYVWAEALVQNVLTKLRERGYDGLIVLGDPQISYQKEGLERLYPQADGFIRGYGEQALCEVVRLGRAARPLGLYWAGHKDPQTQATAALETLPSPWLSRVIPLEGQRFIRWETQRGCPYRCSFCQHREAGQRLKKRDFDRDRIFREIDLFCEADVDDIAVLDPIFTVSRHAEQILQRFVDNGYKGRLSLQCRAEMIKPSFVEVASQLNVSMEFGLQSIWKNEQVAVNRPSDMKKVDIALERVRTHNINHEITIIFGLPEQTLSSFKDTVQWCLERRAPVIKAFPLMLLRGTELDLQRKKWNLRESVGDMPVVLSSNSFSQNDWKEMAKISEALKQTEGHHPNNIRVLLDIAKDIDIDMSRWTSDDSPL